MRALFPVSILLFLLLNACGGHTGGQKTTTDYDEYLGALHTNGEFNGSCLITSGDEVIYKGSFGQADRQNKIPNTDSSIFLIGSLTKPFTAMAILLLEKEGALELSDPLSKFVPDFPNADNVSIEMLLTHRSGIRDYHSFPDWKIKSQSEKASPQQTILSVKRSPFEFSPGERFKYSNTGYILLGMVIERASMQTFERYLRQNIIEPLGLNHTGVIINEAPPDGLAVGYRSTPRETLPAEYINYRQPYTSGNMYSNLHDLRRFCRAVIFSELLPEARTEMIFNPVNGSYGYGWGFRDFNGLKGYGHFGEMNGYVASMTYLPEGDRFIAFLTNDDNTPKRQIANDLVRLLQTGKTDLPNSKESLQLSASQLDRLAGDYLVHEGDTLHVYRKETDSEGNPVSARLYLRENAGIEHELFPYGDSLCQFAEFEFDVRFSSDGTGPYHRLEYFGGHRISAKRIP